MLICFKCKKNHMTSFLSYYIFLLLYIYMYALYFLVMIFIIKCRKYSTFISSLRKCSFLKWDTIFSKWNLFPVLSWNTKLWVISNWRHPTRTLRHNLILYSFSLSFFFFKLTLLHVLKISKKYLWIFNP